MPLDLAQNRGRGLGHLLRFDFESTIYVIVWFAVMRDHEVLPTLLVQWLTTGRVKAALELDLDEGDATFDLGAMEPIRPHLRKQASVLRCGMVDRLVAKDDGIQDFDDETLGGHFTYEILWGELQKMVDVMKSEYM